MKMSNRTYDALKWVAQIFLPALGTFYFVLASALHWPYTDIVVGVMTAFDAFLGKLLGVSTDNYNKMLQASKPDELPDEDAK